MQQKHLYTKPSHHSREGNLQKWRRELVGAQFPDTVLYEITVSSILYSHLEIGIVNLILMSKN